MENFSLVEQERQHYITNLLSETLPTTLKNETQLMKLNIAEKGLFIVLQLNLSNGLKTIINSLMAHQLTMWKAEFHGLLTRYFTTESVNVITLLNLQPFSRMLLISVDPELSLTKAKACLTQCFSSLSQKLKATYQTGISGCFGSFESTFFDIGNSYKKARKLQEYSLIISLGHSCHFDDFCFTEDHSLIEYQHIHTFETLLGERHWDELSTLLMTIQQTLITNSANNAKTTYLYKEIYSLTIRYLFNQIGHNDELIRQLNEGIIMFDHLFDDIYQVHAYYEKILTTIIEADTNTPYSIHIKKALHMVQTEYMKSISLSDVADYLQISDAYLSRLFKEEVGINFKEYLTHHRIQVAKELLLSTHYDLALIGEKIGYSSSTQFIRVFKSIENMTPKEFRRQHTT